MTPSRMPPGRTPLTNPRPRADAAGGAGEETSHAVTPLLPGPPGTAPCYLVHPVGGGLLCYLPLARALSAHHPVRGISSPLLSGHSAPGELSELAADYAARIDADSSGPCLVGGWSFGGAVAFETARRLTGRGRAVRLLVLLDAPAPGSVSGAMDDDTLARQFLYEVRRMNGMSDAEAGVAPAADPLAAAARDLARADPEAGPEETARRFDVFSRHSRSLTGHRAVHPHSGPTLVVDTQPADGGPARGAAWLPHLTGPVHRLTVPTDHFGLMGPEPAADIAAAVERSDPGEAPWTSC
ncbi:thioesterase domain-containing protein [Streptomyces sp. NPDC048192]|uniref:thioesterase domain-containing protein n=1 Tax=Streptomyces sp. NPDC048192 TaxID=3365510 RepID=UPI00371109CA